MKEAAFSLAEAKFATGDFNQQILQNVSKAQIKVRTLLFYCSFRSTKWSLFICALHRC